MFLLEGAACAVVDARGSAVLTGAKVEMAEGSDDVVTAEQLSQP